MQAKTHSSRDDQIVTTTCSYDCGSRCLLRVLIQDEKITHICTENQKILHIQACPRGLAKKSVVYHSDRLTHPNEQQDIYNQEGQKAGNLSHRLHESNPVAFQRDNFNSKIVKQDQPGLQPYG